MLLEFLTHADAGIRTGELDLRDFRVITRQFPASKPDFAVRAVVLDRIADNVHHQPLEVQRTADQVSVLNRIAVVLDLDAALARLLFDHRADAFEQLFEVKFAFLERDFTGFQLAHVQHFVYQFEQQTGGVPDFPSALCLLGCIFLVVIRNLDHAADTVDRCADIMAHALQELGLGPIGLLGSFGGFQQLRTEFLFPAVLLGEIFPCGTSAEHLNRGQHHQIDDERDHHVLYHIGNHRPVGYICVNIVVAAAVQTAEIRTAIALEVPDRIGRKIRLDLLQNPAVLHLGIDQCFVVGCDDAVAVCHHNHAVIAGVVACQRALYGQRIIPRILCARVIIHDDHTWHICPAIRRNIHIGAVRQINPRSIRLLRIFRYIEHGIPLYVLLQRQKIEQIAVIFTLQRAVCVQQDDAGQTLLLCVKLQPLLVYIRAFVTNIAVYLLCIVDRAHQAFGDRRGIVARICRALCLHIIHRAAELLPRLRTLHAHRVKADCDHQHSADRSRNPLKSAGGSALLNLQHGPPPDTSPGRTDTCSKSALSYHPHAFPRRFRTADHSVRAYHFWQTPHRFRS